MTGLVRAAGPEPRQIKDAKPAARVDIDAVGAEEIIRQETDQQRAQCEDQRVHQGDGTDDDGGNRAQDKSQCGHSNPPYLPHTAVGATIRICETVS